MTKPTKAQILTKINVLYAQLVDLRDNKERYKVCPKCKGTGEIKL